MSNRINPWEYEGVSWKNEKQYWNWVRGVLRKGWGRHPVKLEFIKKYKKKIKPNTNPNGRNDWCWGMTCNMCKEDFPLPLSATKERKPKILAAYEELHGKPPVFIEINHKNEAGSLQCKEDVERFAGNLLFVNFDDLESLCQNCHSIVSYSQKEGVSIEEARAHKKAIQIEKEKRVNETLVELGITPASNATKRRKQLVEAFMKEGENGGDRY